MPTGFLIALLLLTAVMTVGIFAGVKALLLEYREELANPNPAYDSTATMELYLWRQEQDNDKRRCPDCLGTRCWDYNRNGRGCGENPTLSTGTGDILAEGRHNKHTVRLVPRGWWPIPATRMGRVNPHLWARLLEHAPIQLRYQGALP